MALPVSSQPRAPLSTKERILRESLELFNREGYGQVSIQTIAQQCGMSNGNLNYHFPTKKSLTVALWHWMSASFEAQIYQHWEKDLALRHWHSESNDENREWLHQQFLKPIETAMKLMWQFRCFFRDQEQFIAVAPELKQVKRQKMVTLLNRLIRRTIVTMSRQGYLQTTGEQRSALIINGFLILRYWISYLEETKNVQNLDDHHFKEGLKQWNALLEPYRP